MCCDVVPLIDENRVLLIKGLEIINTNPCSGLKALCDFINLENISTKDIPKATSRNFGFRSTSKKTAARINSVLDLMIANNTVKIDKDHVELN